MKKFDICKFLFKNFIENKQKKESSKYILYNFIIFLNEKMEMELKKVIMQNMKVNFIKIKNVVKVKFYLILEILMKVVLIIINLMVMYIMFGKKMVMNISQKDEYFFIYKLFLNTFQKKIYQF